MVAGSDSRDIEPRSDDEDTAEDGIEARHLTPDEPRHERSGDELGVVKLGDIGGGGVAKGDEEAKAAGGAEHAHGDEERGETRIERRGVDEHEAESDKRHDSAGEEGEAFGIFGLGEDAGPDDVGGETGDADEAGSVADGVGLAGAVPGMDGDDDAGKSGEDGQELAPGEPFAEEER